jgi:hypothetical protein
VLLGQEVGDTTSGILSLESLDTEKYHNEYLIQTIPTKIAENQ